VPNSSLYDVVLKIFNSPAIIIIVVMIVMKYLQLTAPKPMNVPGSLVKSIESVSAWNDAVEESKKSGDVVVVDFYANWCGPCVACSPAFAILSKAMCPPGNRLQFWKVDVDKLGSVAKHHGVRSMPTFKIFVKGEQVDEMTGWNEIRLKELIRKHKNVNSSS